MCERVWGTAEVLQGGSKGMTSGQSPGRESTLHGSIWRKAFWERGRQVHRLLGETAHTPVLSK